MLQAERIMSLIDWYNNEPYLVTVCRPVSGGIIYVAYGVIQGELEPFEAFLNVPENPVSFDDVDPDLLNFLCQAAKKAFDKSCTSAISQHADVH